jgi:signal transduction histidine kinase
VYATETEARISVRDNGPPLSADAVKTLFETSDMISGRGSAGLLLAMTHHAVVRMGGVLDYAPRSGPGGVFRIRLRLVHANE